MSTAAAHQQMLLRQQYELQQRQIQQMFHEQRQQMAAAQSPPEQQLHHHVSRSGSFGADPTPQQQPQPMIIGGASPLIMPMTGGLAAVPPLSMHPQYHQQQSSPDRGQPQQHHLGGADSPNKMNPQAATFAPSYVAACKFCDGVVFWSCSLLLTSRCFHRSVPCSDSTQLARCLAYDLCRCCV